MSYPQLVDMWEKVLESKAEGLEVMELEATGDHNELWQKGERSAEIMVEVAKSLAWDGGVCNLAMPHFVERLPRRIWRNQHFPGVTHLPLPIVLPRLAASYCTLHTP
jgi:hypothetical protein